MRSAGRSPSRAPARSACRRRAAERIHLAGLLHDVGKVGLERSVLHKPGKLSDDEWEQVRAHPQSHDDALVPLLDLTPPALALVR